MGGIDDDADGGESQAMRGGKPGDQMRFHVHSHRARERVQFPLVHGIRNDGVDADDRSVAGVGNHFGKLARPERVGRPPSRMIDNGGSDHAIAGSKIGRKSAGNPEADDAAAAGALRDLYQVGGFGASAAADHEHVRTRRNARFEGQSNEGNHGAFRQAGKFERPHLAHFHQ